jgi:hypothetical protein
MAARIRAVRAQSPHFGQAEHLAQEAGHHGVPQFDSLVLGVWHIDCGLGELDLCHDDSSESPVSKSRVGATRGKAGSSFGKHRHMLNLPK